MVYVVLEAVWYTENSCSKASNFSFSWWGLHTWAFMAEFPSGCLGSLYCMSMKYCASCVCWLWCGCSAGVAAASSVNFSLNCNCNENVAWGSTEG